MVIKKTSLAHAKCKRIWFKVNRDAKPDLVMPVLE
jgi:hypothetical protein